MNSTSISVIKVRELLLASVPSEPTDEVIANLQDEVLAAMERFEASGLVLDISPVEVMDSFFSRTITETAQMVALMGGKTVIVGMSPAVAITTTELGLTLGTVQTALDMNTALDLFDS